MVCVPETKEICTVAAIKTRHACEPVSRGGRSVPSSEKGIFRGERFGFWLCICLEDFRLEGSRIRSAPSKLAMATFSEDMEREAVVRTLASSDRSKAMQEGEPAY
jgi:hypothetical protein